MHLVLSFLTAIQLLLPCGDGQVYAVKNQTDGDHRFQSFPKIAGKKNIPVYPGRDKALDKLIQEKLLLDPEARKYDFVLNFYFTVKCDGSIGDVVVLGDPEVADWTNIATIIQHTREWQPAYVDGKPVDCIYFRKISVKGSEYATKQS